MDIPAFIAIFIQGVLFFIVFWMLYDKDKKDKVMSNDIVRSYSDTVKDVTTTTINTLKEIETTFLEELTKNQKIHFEQLEKQSSKQLQIVEKQTKEFLTAITTLAEMQRPVPHPIIGPDLFQEKVKNDIEKEEKEEYFLDEIARIPNINEVKVKFEDDEKILGEPIDLME